MIKVLHIITRLDMGGSAQNTLETCLHLDHSRFAVTLLHGLSLESDMTDEEKAAVRENVDRAQALGVRVVPVVDLFRRINLVKDLRALRTILLTIRRQRPDIVHTHTSKAGFLGRLAARLAGVPVIIHTPHGHVFYGHFGRIGSRLFLQLEKMAARFTDRLIALTDQERTDYEQLGVAPAHKLLTAHSGVHLERFGEITDRKHRKHVLPALAEDAFVIGYVGWLQQVKGMMVLLKAMGVVIRRCPQAFLILVGKGCLERQMKAYVGQLGITDHVFFTGWRRDVEQIMPCFDLFVLPSLNEGMGRVLVEAMAAARPIVASKTGGIPDLVRDDENGILVAPGDWQALADGIERLIHRPREAHRMGLRGKQLSRGYTVKAMVQKIEKVYDEALQRKTRLQVVPA